MANKTTKTKPKKKTAVKPKTKKSNSKATKKVTFKEFAKDKPIAIVLAVIIILVIVLACVFGRGVKTGKENFFQKEQTFGIDVSSHNGDIDWDTVSKNADFAIIRAGFRGYESGEIKADSNFETNIKAANKAKIPVGVYFYTQATTKEEAKEEAKFVLHLVRGYDVELPIFFDFEYPYDKKGNVTGRLYGAGLTPDESTEVINEFCKVIRDGGYYSGVYASSNTYISNFNPDGLNTDDYVWVADYNDSVTYTGDYDIWQYKKTGELDGISSDYVDFNYWYLKSNE